MLNFLVQLILLLPLSNAFVVDDSATDIYIRINQLGYLEGESKVAIAFSNNEIKGKFEVVSIENKSVIYSGKARKSDIPGWGTFKYFYKLDFSNVRQKGSYILKLKRSEVGSVPFIIGREAYGHYQETLLEFMRQQRCGYNPYLDMVCHKKDGRSMFGPMPDSTFVDASGGWHDAGDQLKYLITGSYATAHMLLAYELYPSKFADQFNALGQPGSNEIADVLDEAKWGLDWIHKLHPAPDQLFHQVADDRDHRGWKMPDEDLSDYGWGPNGYRVAYFATGEPQGLRQYKSKATGVSNLAGRSAAAMAIASRIWKKDLKDDAFATECLKTAKTLYQLGKEKEGFQQGNSYGAPYRYNEDSWADDMEWGAAELYKLTGDKQYLEEAKHYARKINTHSWMPLDTAIHYKFYPFINVGHYALYDMVDDDFKDTLASYYRHGIEHTIKRAAKNPYNIGVPFIWCSNNLATSLIAQILLYEKMTGDLQYHDFMLEQRDWLFGRNPWGTTMFTGIPNNGEFPVDVHTSVYVMTKQEVPGGLIDGPVYTSIYESLIGAELLDPDEFAAFQNDFVIYHDDIGDYSTNEPTMDGTAGAILMMAHWGMEVEKTK